MKTSRPCSCDCGQLVTRWPSHFTYRSGPLMGSTIARVFVDKHHKRVAYAAGKLPVPPGRPKRELPAGTGHCTTCGILPVADFDPRGGRGPFRALLKSSCRRCTSARQRADYPASRARWRAKRDAARERDARRLREYLARPCAETLEAWAGLGAEPAP